MNCLDRCVSQSMAHDSICYGGVQFGHLEFLENGCITVIKCREILKWTYAFGYYNDRTMEEIKKNLF